jgi:hypothetical protein
MLQQYNTLDGKKLGVRKARYAFTKAIHELISRSKHFYLPANSVMGIRGMIDSAPTANFIMASQNIHMAYKYGWQLYLGRVTLENGHQEYFFSSEKVSPEGVTAPIQWLEIPDNYVVTLEDTADGKTVPEIYPVSYILENPPDEPANGLV